MVTMPNGHILHIEALNTVMHLLVYTHMAIMLYLTIHHFTTLRYTIDIGWERGHRHQTPL
jgi:hypothetical protein